MAELKRIAAEAIPTALEKALRYRLLNEPLEAESICRDVLEIDPGNQTALTTLLLALTDQFERQFTSAHSEAQAIVSRLEGDYEQAYYEGIVHERWAKAQLAREMPVEFAASWFREAMRCYQRAEELSCPEEPDAILRWNTCARLLEKHTHPQPPADLLAHDVQAEFNDDVPHR